MECNRIEPVRINPIIENTPVFLLLSLFLITLVGLGGCADRLSELDEKIKADAEARRGVYVNLSSDLQTAIAIPNSQTEITLLRVAPDGRETEAPLAIDGSIASVKPPKSQGEHDYRIQIWYRTATSSIGDHPLLLASASRTSSAARIEFTADELHTEPYDRNGDGSIDFTEKTEPNYDADGDGVSNLIEILEGENPRSNLLPFVSQANISLVENVDRKGYAFYTATAISPQLDYAGVPLPPITYSIDVTKTDSGVRDLLRIDPVTGELSTLVGKRLPAYGPGEKNVYNIVLIAAIFTVEKPEDEPVDVLGLGNIRYSLNFNYFGYVGQMTLTLTITDIYNLTVSATTKSLEFAWAGALDNDGNAADYYQLLQDINGVDDFIAVSREDSQGKLVPLKIRDTKFRQDFALHLAIPQAITQYKIAAYREAIDVTSSDTLILTSIPLTLGELLSFPQDITAMIGYLKASNAGANDQFANSVSLSADGFTLAVGAMGAFNNTGAVYVYERQADKGWQEQVMLTASNAAANDQFAYTVVLSADGRSLLVGAVGANNNMGAVYVFERQLDNSWKEQIILTAATAGVGDFFGASLALSADGATLAVGAQNKNNNTGAVYVFERQLDNSWKEQVILAAANTGVGDFFGASLTLSADGRSLVLGATRANNGTGAVYVFARQTDNSWLEQVALTASNATVGDLFGASVSLSADGRSVAVGANSANNNTGAVYVYAHQLDNSWLEQATLTASNAAVGDLFGDAISLSSEGLALAVGANNANSNTGAVYLFERQPDNSWLEQSTLVAPNAGVGDEFGSAVTLNANGQTLAVGAIKEDSGNDGGQIDTCADVMPTLVNCQRNSGAVYVY